MTTLLVPDIGDFSEVEIIELLVKEGDTVAVEQSLITVESDKASMEIPASAAGKITRLLVKLGDKVSKGTPLAEIEAASGGGTPPAAAAEPQPAKVAELAPVSAPVAVPGAAVYNGAVDVQCDMLVLGAGPGGYSAAFRSADLGMSTVLVERYATLGGVCLNVGCIPSKALLHTAQVLEEAQHMADHGVAFTSPSIDLDKLRAHKAGVVGKLTGGLAGMGSATGLCRGENQR